MWALLPLLLAAALTIPLLDVDGFNGDEPVSLAAAGVFRSGTYSLADIWNYMLDHDPRNAPGWPVLLALWGRLAGWSEVAIRALALFAGSLAIAWVFRTGRDLFAPGAGLFAALLLSTSVFFLAYMANARAYSLVALFASLSLWCYWRVALHPRLPDRNAESGLLLGSIGLLYSHYFGAVLLPAIGLFHLFFVPKDRRWWRSVFLIGLAGVIAALQFSLLQDGLKIVVSADLRDRVLTAPAILSHLLRFMTNGLLDPSPPLAALILISLLLMLILVTLLRLRGGYRFSASWLLVFTSAILLALMILINELARVMVDNRIRYLMPLWPLTALLAGAGLWRLARKRYRIVTALLALWLALGAWLILATDFRYETGYFFRTDHQDLYSFLSQRIPVSDLFLLDVSVLSRVHGFSSTNDEFIYRYKVDPYEAVRPIHISWPYMSLLYLTKDRVGFADLPTALGRVFCERLLEESGLTLDRYALQSVENCPESLVRLAFDSDIQLTAPEISIQDGLLRLDAHFRSADKQLLANYSLAVHVLDTRGERVAQGDTGVGPGAIVPLRSEIDVSELPPGEYDVRVALYDWQTGVRLQARDLETDEVSDMHTLHRFRHD